MRTTLAFAAVLFAALSACAQEQTVAATAGVIEARAGKIFRPVISGPWVAWAETGVNTVYAKNLETSEVVEVSEPGQAVILEWAPWHPQVGISGHLIVWMNAAPEDSGLQQQIWSYNLKTKERKVVGPREPAYGGENMFPAIDGPWVAWQAHEQGDVWPILVHNLDTGDQRALAQAALPLPSISGDRMVWDDRARHDRLMVTDLTTGDSRPFFTTTKQQNPRAPVLCGNLAAWSMRDLTAGTNIVKIMAYRFDRDQAIEILPHTGSVEHRANTAVGDGLVLWEDWRNNQQDVERANLDVYGYDLATGKQFPVATGPGNQHLPWISGKTAVWIDESGDKPRIGWKIIDVAEALQEPSSPPAPVPAMPPAAAATQPS